MPLEFDILSIIIIIACLIVSLVLHEMMHAYVGLKLGDTTAQSEGRISLNPMNHIDPFMTILLPIITVVLFHVPILVAKPVPLDPRNLKYDEFGAAMVAAAGPLTNLALAAIGAIILNLFIAGGMLANIALTFTILNVALFVFNLVPIPPLDGSRVLYALAPEPIQEFMARLEGVGLIIVFGLVILVPEFGQILVNINSGITDFLVRTL